MTMVLASLGLIALPFVALIVIAWATPRYDHRFRSPEREATRRRHPAGRHRSRGEQSVKNDRAARPDPVDDEESDRAADRWEREQYR